MIADIQAIVRADGGANEANSGKTDITEPLCGREIILYPLSLLTSLQIPTTIIVESQPDSLKNIVEKAYPSTFSYGEPQTYSQQHILIMRADMPLLKAELIEKLYAKHIESNAPLTFAYAHNNDLSGSSYDKVVKTENSFVIKTAEEMESGEEYCCVEGGLAIASKEFLTQYINCRTSNPEMSYAISNLVAFANQEKETIAALSVPFDQVRGVLTFQELWAAEQIKRAELITYWMNRGVRFSTPQTVHIDLDVQIGSGSFVGCSAHLTRGTIIGKNCTVGPFSILKNTILGDAVQIKPYSILHNTTVGNKSVIGPFAHLQEETIIGNNCHVGNFVEIKRSTMADRTKAKHLAYLGDAIIGSHVNIGAGSITCNYDGKEKHTTTINDNVFIGTNNSLIAPVTIGKGAFTAAGSVITNDVPQDALAIARAKQINKEGYARKLKQEDIPSSKNGQETKPSFLFVGAVKSPPSPTTK